MRANQFFLIDTLFYAECIIRFNSCSPSGEQQREETLVPSHDNTNSILFLFVKHENKKK